ncbi:hypothetical protein D018_1378B, partial [Vibrio parahaemolyticus VP2007-007]
FRRDDNGKVVRFCERGLDFIKRKQLLVSTIKENVVISSEIQVFTSYCSDNNQENSY